MIVLEILGIIGIFLLLAVSVIVLPLLGGLLKSVNKSLGSRGPELKKQVRDSVASMDTAGQQIEAMALATKSARLGMNKALEASDRVLAFLNSKVFQLGVPAVMWVLFFVIAVPRGLFARARWFKPVEPIPPPSWETESD